MATTTDEPELTPIKFSRLTRRGVLLGLSGPQLLMASLASGTLISGLYVGAALLMTFPIILLFVALAFVGVGGRKLIAWAPIGARWLWRSSGGQLLYRRRVVNPRPGGTLALPGDAARRAASPIVSVIEAVVFGLMTSMSICYAPLYFAAEIEFLDPLVAKQRR